MLFYSETKHLKVYRKGGNIQFVDGQYEANEDEAEILRRVPECWCDETPVDAELEKKSVLFIDHEDDWNKMTVTELRTYAKDNNIELPKGLRGADEVLAAIKDAE